MRNAISEIEASLPRVEEQRMPDVENDGDNLELNEKEVKFLKRSARKRKWVRRLRRCNDLAHAICKSLTISLDDIVFLLVWVLLAGVVLYKTNFFKQLWENPEVN